MESTFSEELEKSILGTILVDPKCNKYLKQLNSTDFYLSKNQIIFNLMQELYSKNNPIDLIAVKELAISKKLNDKEIFEYLVYITDYQLLTLNLMYHINKLKNYSTRRKLIIASKEIIKAAEEANSDEDAAELKKNAIREISNIKTNNINIKQKEMLNIITQTMTEIEEKYNKRNDNTYNTGFFDLDKIIDGLHKQELTIIAARPRCRKNKFCIKFGTEFK